MSNEQKHSDDRYVAVRRIPVGCGARYKYIRSDDGSGFVEGYVYSTWSEAYEVGRGAPWTTPAGTDWEAITIAEADAVWAAIDGREGDGGFNAAFRLCREYGDNIPTEEEFAKMDNPEDWPASYAWGIIHCKSKAHANRLNKAG